MMKRGKLMKSKSKNMGMVAGMIGLGIATTMFMKKSR